MVSLLGQSDSCADVGADAGVCADTGAGADAGVCAASFFLNSLLNNPMIRPPHSLVKHGLRVSFRLQQILNLFLSFFDSLYNFI